MAKRLIDIVLSLVALVALLPLLAVVALLVRLDSPGPALFRQRRIGKDGRRFTVLKFRTMHHNADDRPHREAIERAANGQRTALANGKHVFKPADDPRVTRLGRFLRASGLDELPQLINVLRGEMSLVGPRPAIEYELAYYQDWHHRRFAVRPGLTGPWQVRRSEAENLSDMLRMDVEYCATCSLWGDVKLMAMTIPAIIRERGVF
jgi:lipopolysaccharide/colanic/teichoic acid biosynthesis glycosyltransferase